MSTLSVDTITGKSTSTNLTIGSTPVVSASANSLTIRGEGSAQTDIQQGLCKAWTKSSSAAARLDSFNMDGSTDHGASGGASGTYSYSLVNPFSSVNYAMVAMGNSTDQRRNVTELGTSAATDTLAIETSDGGTLDDTAHSITAHGDLA